MTKPIKDAPEFKDYKEAQAWIRSGIKKHGKGPFTCSEQYKKALPKINELFSAQRAAVASDLASKMKESGQDYGQRVCCSFGGMLGYSTAYGTIAKRGGRPIVKLDSPMFVSSRGRVSQRKSVPWSDSWVLCEDA